MTLPYTTEINALLDTLSADSAFDVAEKLQVFEQSEVLAVVAKRLLDVEAAPGGLRTAGSDKQIQYNDGGSALGASPDFVWDNGTLKLVATENNGATIRTNAPGVQLQIIAADGDATHVGGEMDIRSGASDGQNGGDLQVTAGGDNDDGTGGNVTIASGSSVNGDGGEIAIRANGTSQVGGEGGQILIIGGSGAGGGGNVQVAGGPADGQLQLYSGDGNHSVVLSTFGVSHSGKVGFFDATPVTQPGVPVTLDDVIAALKALGLVAT